MVRKTHSIVLHWEFWALIRTESFDQLLIDGLIKHPLTQVYSGLPATNLTFSRSDSIGESRKPKEV